MKNNKKYVCSAEVFGASYDIYLVDFLNAQGETNITNREIYIQRGLCDNETKSTILHELIHSSFYETGFINYCNDETLVYWLERFIPLLYSSALKINKEFKILGAEKNKTSRVKNGKQK